MVAHQANLTYETNVPKTALQMSSVCRWRAEPLPGNFRDLPCHGFSLSHDHRSREDAPGLNSGKEWTGGECIWIGSPSKRQRRIRTAFDDKRCGWNHQATRACRPREPARLQS